MCTPCCSNGDDQEFKVSQKDHLVLSAPALNEDTESQSEVSLMGKATRPASHIYDVELELYGKDHGLEIEAADEEFAIITGVAGVAEERNAKANVNEVIKPFDRVLEIDGEEYKSRASAVFKRLSEEAEGKKIKLKLQQAVERTVVLERSGQLGMTVNYKKASRGIWIASIVPGLLWRWNQDHPDQVVSPHDRIIQVGERVHDPIAIVQKLQDTSSTEKLEIKVMSYAL
eukprot:TRINITY_DN15238_c0_g2_i1.p1 TRINITY_DN15238_c0_g2~~TRINITY_DN15238_c0_g2_i1.p1  ORF type:complete len:229 (+),score=50.88 TRINITY_DN15238_c0_g2_i1:55-741(+)